MYFEFDTDSPDQADQSSGNDSSATPDSRKQQQQSRCTTTLRNRRYSIHSDVPSRSSSSYGQPFRSGPNCDLALLAKKKLDEVDESTTLGEIYEPDIKISKAKHSSSDLRREVLLHSMQRSLSMSSEDLSSIGSSSSMRLSPGPSRSHSFLSKRTSPLLNRLDNDMEILREDFFSDSRLMSNSPYKPAENQVQHNSRMIYTTTNSLAGSRLSENRHHYLTKRQNSLSTPSSSISSNHEPSSSNLFQSSPQMCQPGEMYNNESMDNSCNDLGSTKPSGQKSHFPYPGLNSRTILTHSSNFSSPSPLKKRCHPSPTKCHAFSPYHINFGSPMNSLTSTLTLSRDHSTPLFSTGTFSPPPDPTNKKFKGSSQVQFPKLNLFNNDVSSPIASTSAPPVEMSNVNSSVNNDLEIFKAPLALNSVTPPVFGNVSSLPSTSAFTAANSFVSSSTQTPMNSSKNDGELGQLAQDFDRLKTPFQ